MVRRIIDRPASKVHPEKDLLVLALVVLLYIVLPKAIPKVPNARRDIIKECIPANPGCPEAEVIARTGLNRGTVRHHLRVLLDRDYLVNHGKSRYSAFFSTKTGISPAFCTCLPHLYSPIRTRILIELHHHPALRLSALSSNLAMNASILHYHLNRLLADRVIRCNAKAYGLSEDPVTREEIRSALISSAGKSGPPGADRARLNSR